MKRILLLLLALTAIMLLPYLGALIQYDNTLPAGYFNYPVSMIHLRPPTSWIYLIAFSIIGLGIGVIYFLPKWVGFKAPVLKKAKPIKQVAFPIWFWIGLVMWAIPIALFWTKASEPSWLIYWADIPIFWGISFMLDGIVYRRTGGKSIISMNPRELLAIGVASMGGWMLFQYLNFYVQGNWYYPQSGLLSDSHFLLYSILGSGGLMPMAFEMYTLLRTIKWLPPRYENGIKWDAPKWLKLAVMIGMMGGMLFTGYSPDSLFFLLWLGPVTILGITLSLLNIWTPFKPIAKGNWSPFLVFCLTYFFVGFILEGQNYFSGYHEVGSEVQTFNPSYWVYNIPYVDVLHIFEMPALGFLGYLPFGIYCWVWWIFVSYLLNIPSYLADPTDDSPPFKYK
ncbi:MAG: hypothetical protein AB8H47_13960 [Bacteroidia bacterium]